MTGSERVPLTQAAIELGIGPQRLREHMKRGLLDIGVVIPPDKTCKQTRYLIYRGKLNKVLGKA